jgi:hypothetical protein
MTAANRKNAMTTAKAEKCAHPVCSCLTTSGKYYSVECEAKERRGTPIVCANKSDAKATCNPSLHHR